MLFGVFDHMDRAGPDLASQYENRLVLIEAYEKAGFRGYHVAEHHSTPLGLCPSPSLFLASAAQRTSRIRLGSMVHALSLYHPLRLLEEVCMLDNLSHGRLDLGIGRGISPIELGFYGVGMEEAQQRYEEARAILLQGLTGDRVSFKGKHFDFSDVPVELQSLQKPLPLWYGAAKPETADWAAQNGINIVCNGAAASVGAITGRFKSAWRDSGKRMEEMPLAGMSRHVILAETDEEAREIARPAYRQWFQHLTYLWRLNNLQIPLAFPPEFDDADAAGFCFVGSPSTVRDKMKTQLPESGISYLLCRLAFGNLAVEHSLRSIDLMRREVMPAFEEARAA